MNQEKPSAWFGRYVGPETMTYEQAMKVIRSYAAYTEEASIEVCMADPEFRRVRAQLAEAVHVVSKEI